MDKTERMRVQENFRKALKRSHADAVAFVDDRLKSYFLSDSSAKRPGADNEELWQEVLFKLWKALAKGTLITDVVGFVNRIWRFTAIDIARKAVPLHVEWLDSEDESSAKRADPILNREAREALVRLPVRDKGILMLRIFLDWTWSDISALLGLPISTVRSHAFAALAELRHRLDSHKGL